MDIKVLLIDDQEISQAGVRTLLVDTSVRCVGVTSDPDEAMRLAEEKRPDIVLFDVQAESFSGLNFLYQFRLRFPMSRVIVLTATNSPVHLTQSATLGVKDFLLKSISAHRLISTIQNVYYGTHVSANEAWNRVLKSQSSHGFREESQRLTPREEQVLRHIVLGLSNKEIAKALQISTETVKDHVQHILHKLGAKDRTQAAVWAVRKGLT